MPARGSSPLRPSRRVARSPCSRPALDSRSLFTWSKRTVRAVRYTAPPITTRISPTAMANQSVRRQRAALNTSVSHRVARTADRADQLPLVAAIDLAPEVRHIDVDQVGVRRIVLPPDVVQDLRAGHDAALIAHQELQEGKLLRAEVDGAALADGSAAAQVQHQVRHLELIGVTGLDSPPAQRPQTGEQLLE